MLRGSAQGRPVAPLRAGLAGAAMAGLLLASCTTVPVRTPSQWMGVLPADATLYASLRVRASPAVVTQLLLSAQPQAAGQGQAAETPARGPSAAELDQLVDRTERMVLAATLVPQGRPSFAAVALGSYPAGLMGCRLSGSREWQKQSSTAGAFWQSRKTGLQVAVPGRSVLLAASSGIEALLRGYASPGLLPMPEEARLEMESRDLALYLPELPGGALPPGAGQVPIREVWVVGSRGPGGWTVAGTANTGSEKDAKLVSMVLRFALVAWMRGQSIQGLAEKLRPVTIAPEGSQVKLAGLSLTEQEMGQVLLSLVAGQASPAGAPAAPEAQSP